MPKHDWDYYRERYVVGDVTLEDLSQLPGAPHFSTIRNRAATEGWTRLRDAHRVKVATRTRDIAATDEAELANQQMRIGRAIQTIGLTALRGMDTRTLTARDAAELVKTGHRMQLDSFAFQAKAETTDGELVDLLEAMANPIDPATRVAEAN